MTPYELDVEGVHEILGLRDVIVLDIHAVQKFVFDVHRPKSPKDLCTVS